MSFIHRDSNYASFSLNVNKSFLNRDLSFLDKKFEDAYKAFNRGSQFLQLKMVLVFGISLFSVNWALNPLSLDLYQGTNAIFNSLNLLLISACLIFCLKRKNFEHPHLALFLLQLYIFIVIMEILRLNHSKWNITMFVLVSFVFGQLFLIMMVARCPWKLNSLSALSIHIYLSARLTDLGDNALMRGYPYMIFLCSFLFVTFSSYLNERFDRRAFFARAKDDKSLKDFEHLIKEVLPSAMLVVKKQEVVFYNEQTSRLLSISDEHDVEPKLRQIIIEKPEGSSTKTKTTHNQINLEKPHNDLYEIIDSLRDVSSLSQGFQSFSGLLLQSGMEEKSNTLEKIVDIKIGKIDWEGEEALLVILAEDLVTQRMNYLTEQGRYKDKLLATVSHDLRTPLNGVIGILELVLENISDPVQKKSLLLALRSSHLLLFMINDILDMSQITNGKLRLNPVDFSPVQVVKEVAKLIKFQAKKKGLRFFLEDRCSGGLEPDSSFLMRNDPNRLKQVILNLMGNALKFTQEGSIKVRVEPWIIEGPPSLANSRSLQRRNSIKIAVEDSGCGIRPNEQSRLFKLFGKLDNIESRKLNQSGIGLGLAISQNLVKLMSNNMPGEEIKVISEYGKGSIFYFNLHSFSEDEEEKQEIEATGDWVHKSQADIVDEGIRAKAVPVIDLQKRKKNVLIVDDDQINILVLTNFFKSFTDCVYDVAFNGRQALDRVTEKAKEQTFYDIIFMDCNMPVMDGFEATREILGLMRLSQIPFVPIIASTANASSADQEKCYQAGMVDVISKPFNKARLRSILDESIRKYTELR